MASEWCLHTEDGLHILGCRGAERSSHHKDGRPRFDAHTCCQTATTQCDGIGLVRVRANGIIHHLQGFCIFLVLIAIACHIDNFEQAKDRMCLQLGTQSPGGSNTGNHPERMTEDPAEGVTTIGIETVLIVLTEQVEETVHIFLVYQRIILFRAEELTEVESLLIFHVITHQRSEVIGIDIDDRQRFVWVGVAHMCQIPFGFGTLLHHIVPSEDFVFAIVIKEIEGRARQA